MRTTWKPPGNKTKLTFLIVLTFLFFISGSVYGQEEVKKEYWGNSKLKSETPHNGLVIIWYESGKKKLEILPLFSQYLGNLTNVLNTFFLGDSADG